MADTSKITLGQLKTALTQAKNYTDNEIADITGVSKVEPEELDMPKVFFYGAALPTTKDNVNLTMDYISNTTKFSSFVKLKCQGTSSMSYAKKNFTVAMYSDEARATKLKKDFKGWGAQSKFCLKANYVDTTHTRNLSGARIAYDMVNSRPDSPFKQQLLQCPRNGAVDGFPIKLYFNGEFYGIYTWNIPKDAWMFNMDKSNPNHVVLCAEKNTDGNANLINSCQFRQLWTNGDGNDWSVEVGTYSQNMVDSFNRCINFVMTATDQEFHDNIGEYFDLYSLLDYYCFSYLTCHLDGLAKNMLMVTYDGVHWGASLYDMDSIYGVSWNGASYVATNYQCPEQYQEQFSALWPRIEKCFGAELYARYRELRKGALSLSNIVKHVEEIYDVIPDRVFVDEKAKWTSLPQVNANTMTRFRNYMRDRAVYVDAEMLAIGTKVPCTGISLDKNALTLGVGGTIDDSGVNYLENVTWELGTLNGGDKDYQLTDSTADYRCQLTDLPLGTYTLHHDTYTYKKLGLNDNGVILVGTNASGSNNTNDITFNITNSDTIVDISVFSNGVTPITGVTLTRTDISNIQEYSIEYTTANSPNWGANVNADYLLLEFIIGSKADVDINKLVNICIGDDKYYISNTTSSNAGIINALPNKCNCLTYLGNVIVNVALPKSKYGNALDDFKTYCSSNGISNIYINKNIQNTSGTLLSAQLTATVTPENCTQPVVWSVSPEGIVTVDNGLVTAVAKGEATVTATCGSYSDTCAVTVSGITITETEGVIQTTYTSGYIVRYSDHISAGVNYGDLKASATDITTDFINHTPGNYYVIEQPSTQYGCGIVIYDADKKYLSTCVNDGRTWVFQPGAPYKIDFKDTNITIDNIPENATYIRMSFNVTDSSSITIKSHSGGNTGSGNSVITLDGSLSYSIPEYPDNASGQNGQVLVEYVLPGLTKVPTTVNMEGRTKVNEINLSTYAGVANIYSVKVWQSKVYLVFTLDMATTGVENTIESITTYLSTNPLTFEYKL